MVAIVESADDKKPSFSIPVLALIKAAQQQHGLRHGDYQRYHQYISRKLRRMRKSLHFQQGTRAKVTPKKITADIVTDPRFVLLKVFEIERGWAYAMQLKAESNTALRKRFHMFARLKKAVLRSTQLSDLMDELTTILDPQTTLELNAYIQWIRGTLSFELQDWVKAKEFLESTRAIYDGLIETVSDEDNRTIYTARVDEILPQIHYCAYNIGDESAASDLQRMQRAATTTTDSDVLASLQLDQLLTQARAGQVGQVTEVDWLGSRIPVKVERAKMAVLVVQDSEAELLVTTDNSLKLSLYESMLRVCGEALQAVREELRLVTSDAPGATSRPDKQSKVSSEKVARLQTLCSYLQFIKLNKTVERTLLQIDGALSNAGVLPSYHEKHRYCIGTSAYSKPNELSRLYDTLVQNLQEMVGLPGRIQECMGLRDLLQAKMLAYRSHRCFYLAFTYNQGKRFAECSALLQRAKNHAEAAIVALSPNAASWTGFECDASPGPTPDALISELNALIMQVEAEDLTCRASHMLDVSGAKDRLSTGGTSTDNTVLDSEKKLAQKVMIDRLETYLEVKSVEDSLHNLAPNPFVRLPPDFEPVPVKPIFFDLALSHINFPSLSDKLSSKTAKESGAGLAGMVRGWLWGGSSDQS